MTLLYKNRTKNADPYSGPYFGILGKEEAGSVVYSGKNLH